MRLPSRSFRILPINALLLGVFCIKPELAAAGIAVLTDWLSAWWPAYLIITFWLMSGCLVGLEALSLTASEMLAQSIYSRAEQIAVAGELATICALIGAFLDRATSLENFGIALVTTALGWTSREIILLNQGFIQRSHANPPPIR
ncbi:MAG: hypothetical protein ACFHX7_22070 [Pseudomonadota bacterium]